MNLRSADNPCPNVVSAPQELADLMTKGDARCNIPVGSRVYKSAYEPDDLHSIGDQGQVVGNLYVTCDGSPESLKLVNRNAYLVVFDGDPAASFILGHKIDALSHGTA